MIYRSMKIGWLMMTGNLSRRPVSLLDQRERKKNSVPLVPLREGEKDA